MEYKVEDKIRWVKNNNGSKDFIGQEGTITGVTTGTYCYKVSFSIANFAENELELINQKIMNQVKAMFKRLTDAGAQTLYKAGYINGDLELTDKGTRALNAINFDANKPALVAEAQAELDEEAKQTK